MQRVRSLMGKCVFPPPPGEPRIPGRPQPARGRTGIRGHKRSLLAQAEGLGCTNYGLPLLPKKMKIQNEW